MRKRNLLLAIASGALLAISMPKPGWWLTAWFGLAPLLIALRGARAREAAVYGLVTGLAYYGVILFWLTLFGYLPWSLVALKETFWLVLFAVAASRLLPERTGWFGYLAVPAAWTVSQWARVLGPLGFTWGSLAHTQATNLPVIQMASVTGPWGIDFIVCLANLALADLTPTLPSTVLRTGSYEERGHVDTPPPLRRGLGGGRRVATIALIVSLTPVAAGWHYLSYEAPRYRPKTRVCIVQASLPHKINPEPGYVPMAYEVYDKMSRRTAHRKWDFVIWPETTIVDDITDTRWGPQIAQLARDTHANYIIGGYDPSGDPEGRSYNSAHFYDRTGRKIGVYHKVHLVPYGEYVPLRKQMPWLKRYGIRDVDVLPGRSHNLTDTEIGRVGVSICFESLFPAVSAQETRNGARALVIITNDAWFGRTQAARHHAMMAYLRAVENRRYVVRAAATGISAIIDPSGRVLSELPIYNRGILTGSIAPLSNLTPYARFGDWFVFGCMALLVLRMTSVSRFVADTDNYDMHRSAFSRASSSLPSRRSSSIPQSSSLPNAASRSSCVRYAALTRSRISPRSSTNAAYSGP